MTTQTIQWDDYKRAYFSVYEALITWQSLQLVFKP